MSLKLSDSLEILKKYFLYSSLTCECLWLCSSTTAIVSENILARLQNPKHLAFP